MSLSITSEKKSKVRGKPTQLLTFPWEKDTSPYERM